MASSFNLNAYGAMFRVRAAYSFEVGGLLVRMYAFMRTIGTVSMLTLSGYSYFMAGLVASVVAFARFLISPRVSKKIDERGQGAIVLPATCIALSGCAILLIFAFKIVWFNSYTILEITNPSRAILCTSFYSE